MAEESIATLLNRVWAEFRRAGITDDLRIIEAVAALLLKQEGIPLTDDLPRKPKSSELDEETINNKLKAACDAAGDAGNLFDRYILFRLPKMLRGGQYVTPRHIVRLMISLAETHEQSITDFACGSAGFLVYSEGEALTGVEISPEWARIARANLALHRLSGEIREGNALRMVKVGETFTRIVMNPPFGAKIKSDFGARSETALTYLALEHLEQDGRAALLAPSGLLFSGSQAETKLRQRLVDDLTLEAVITLPDASFQPYSTLTTHLLLIENTMPGSDACTWFLRPVYDGYVSGRGRDLTIDPKTPNDLILMGKAVKEIRQGLSAKEGYLFETRSLSDDGILLGILIRPLPESTLLTVRYLPAIEQDSVALLLLEIEFETQRTFWQVPLYANALPKAIENPETLIRERLGLKKRAELPPVDVFQVQNIRWGKSETRRVDGILVKTFNAEKPQLMGVAIPSEILRIRGYALQPDDYLRAPEISAELIPPHDVLRNIYKRQCELNQRIEKLAGWLVPEHAKARSIPPPVAVETPFGSLSETQKEIWNRIYTMRANGSAKPFTPQDISAECSEDEKRLALAIFEAMGLIVPLTLEHPETEQPMNFYRLAEENDLWAGAEGESA